MKKYGWVIMALVLAISITGITQRGQADDIAVNFTSVAGTGTPNFTNGAWSLGWEFTTLVPMEVTELGMYTGGGITQNHDVGIYDTSGNLLVSTTVLTTDPTSGLFTWDTLTTPYLLPPGTYAILGESGVDPYTGATDTASGAFSYGNILTDFSIYPGIQWDVGNLFTSSSTLVFTLNTDGSAPYGTGTSAEMFGPDFQFQPVPEPATMLLLGSGLLGLAGLWRRFKK